MRYMTYEVENKKILLTKEIEYIDAFLELQKLRFSSDERDRIAYEIEGNPGGSMIEPMLLIPFVENAFKHGRLAQSTNQLKIEIKVDQKLLNFKCINDFADSTKDKTGGVGLKNVKRRLELLYSNSHRLTIKKENNTFSVDLELKLN
jgi:two-component system, LytTR family, sensor kinase